jgi:hypothetical protein
LPDRSPAGVRAAHSRLASLSGCSLAWMIVGNVLSRVQACGAQDVHAVGTGALALSFTVTQCRVLTSAATAVCTICAILSATSPASSRSAASGPSDAAASGNVATRQRPGREGVYPPHRRVEVENLLHAQCKRSQLSEVLRSRVFCLTCLDGSEDDFPELCCRPVPLGPVCTLEHMCGVLLDGHATLCAGVSSVWE